jgi:hypothetical protein
MPEYNGLQLVAISNGPEFRNFPFPSAITFSRGNGLKMVYRKLSKENHLSVRQKARIRFWREERKFVEHRPEKRLSSPLITSDCPGAPR